MPKHKQIIEKLASTYQSNGNNLALLVTGSVARDEYSENSDLDLLLVAKEKQPFREELIDGIVVEVKTNTLDGFVLKMKDDPMNIYQWLDAKVIFDSDNVSERIINEAKNIYDTHTSAPKEISGTKKWLESAKIKIESTQQNNDELALGFNVSNILWQIVRGLYLLNNKPVPPNTTAFGRINKLENLPNNFDQQWKDLLTGDLEKRSNLHSRLNRNPLVI